MNRSVLIGALCAFVLLCGQARASYTLSNLTFPFAPLTANVVNTGLGVNVDAYVGEMEISVTPALFGKDRVLALCVDILHNWYNNTLNNLATADSVFSPTVSSALLSLMINASPTDSVQSAAMQLVAWQIVFPGTVLVPDGNTAPSLVAAVMGQAALYTADLSSIWSTSSGDIAYVLLPTPDDSSQRMLVVNTPEPGISITTFLLGGAALRVVRRRRPQAPMTTA